MVHINQKSGTIMLTQNQLNVFSSFTKYPFKAITRQEVKKICKEKSNNALSRAFSQFKHENLLIEKKVGKSSLFNLNLKNDLVYYYLALANHNRMKKLVALSIEDIKDEVKHVTSFFSIAIFGSYAIQEERKDSDLDVAIFCFSREEGDIIKRYLNNAKIKSPLNLDIHVIIKGDMIEMLTNTEENLGKQIARKHMVIYNHQLFYDLLNGGMKHVNRI
jgi:predicted nucleotidyltransferase